MDDLGNHIYFLPLSNMSNWKRWISSDSTRLLHNQRLWSQCHQLLLPVDAAEIMAGSKPVMFATRLLQNSTGYHSTNTEVVEPSVCSKVFILAKHVLAVAGCLETFPKIVKRTQKTTSSIMSLEKKTLSFPALYLCFVVFTLPLRSRDRQVARNFQCSRSFRSDPGLWSSKVSSNWAIPCEALPNKLLKLTWFLVCKMSWHTRGKFMPATCQQNGDSWIDAFLGVQWAPPAKKTIRKFTNSKMQNLGMRKPPPKW